MFWYLYEQTHRTQWKFRATTKHFFPLRKSQRKTWRFWSSISWNKNTTTWQPPLLVTTKYILQIKQFQYRFFQSIILNENTIPQSKIFSQFSLKFLRFNYEILWEQQNQDAYINFPQVLTEVELLPFVIGN